MTTLHVKSPNGNQKDVDIDKICTTDGFTMNGDIVSNFKYKNAVDNGRFMAFGGTTEDSPLLILYGKNHPIYPGQIELRAANGTSISHITGSPDGNFKINGYDILTGSNYSQYALPLNGGQLSGDIYYTDNTHSLEVCGGTGTANAAYVSLCGRAQPNSPGEFEIHAVGDSGNRALVGKPDGTLTWNGHNVITANGGTFTGTIVSAKDPALVCNVDNGYLVLCGGSAYNKGAYLNLHGEQYTDDPSGFEINARLAGTTTRSLKGHNNGLLEWNGNICIPYPFMFEIQANGLVKGTAVTTGIDHVTIPFMDKNKAIISSIYQRIRTDYRVDIGFLVESWNSSGHNGVFMSSYSDGDYAFWPNSDNGVYLGLSNARWRAIYAVSGTINTSDERVKDNITSIPDDVLDAWSEVNWYQFQFKDAISEKGNDARIHTGAIAQRIKSVFESHGIDAFRYGLLCYDEWDAEEESVDEDGNVTTPAKPAGNMYSLRYEEALCMEAAYQRRRADRLEERIARLEALLDSK